MSYSSIFFLSKFISHLFKSFIKPVHQLTGHLLNDSTKLMSSNADKSLSVKL